MATFPKSPARYGVSRYGTFRYRHGWSLARRVFMRVGGYLATLLHADNGAGR